ncbi:uncharacterized protein BO96DRAFT_436125 [Aspergillus niger CBS 101883]|uniref:Uncharacterized protein n=2 Tax=Aspergillus niger TaxID=5061 RepID=A2R6R6_ASPNC|nr:uncharacterized protein BO96DRAFT_436125 [Aspergillus niger CBS 101883]XP_059604747.1 hypothetical protein An16g00950 [Aspergillus niger]PYH54504.1 hypothetical protein BO96DRAFT_436125 [Aspergillus niger CBS 101883]CAK46781.1 hypothetical protein An16g00950 [Aspergillus niger]
MDRSIFYVASATATVLYVLEVVPRSFPILHRLPYVPGASACFRVWQDRISISCSPAACRKDGFVTDVPRRQLKWSRRIILVNQLLKLGYRKRIVSKCSIARKKSQGLGIDIGGPSSMGKEHWLNRNSGRMNERPRERYPVQGSPHIKKRPCGMLMTSQRGNWLGLVQHPTSGKHKGDPP